MKVKKWVRTASKVLFFIGAFIAIGIASITTMTLTTLSNLLKKGYQKERLIDYDTERVFRKRKL